MPRMPFQFKPCFVLCVSGCRKKVFCQRGRGLIELFCVLALAGVLSLTALVMFGKLRVKNEANALYDDIQRRTLLVWDKEDLSLYEAEAEIPLPEMETNPYDISVYRVEETENDGAAFVVEISNLTRETCVELLHKPFATPYLLQVGDREFDPDNPDYSVCDVFDEAAVTLFVSSVWAADGRPSITIPFGFFDITISSSCKNKQTFRKYTGEKGECCLDHSTVVPVKIDGYHYESCCPLNNKGQANEAVPISGGRTMCCYGNEEAAFNPGGGYRCCSYPLPILGATGKACCGQVDYDTGEVTEIWGGVQPAFDGEKILCCHEYGAYKKEDGFYACCHSLGLENSFATDIFGLDYQTCCDVTRHAYVNDNGKVQCCPYSNEDGSYAFVDVIGAPNPRKTCCPKIMKSSQYVGYFKDNQSLCCDGNVYQTETGYDCCAIERTFDDNLKETISVMRQVVTVVGAPTEMQTCCETTKDGVPGAIWKNDKAVCCEPADTVFQTLEKEYGCCTNSAEFLNVIGFPEQQHCCAENHYAYWDGTGYGCHHVREEIKLIEGYPNTNYEVSEAD